MMDRLLYDAFRDELTPATLDSGIVEIPLLLPAWQAEVLEDAAHDRGLTAAEMVRQLLRSFIAERLRAGNNRPSAGRTNVVIQ